MEYAENPIKSRLLFNINNMGNTNYDVIVTFTFEESVNLGDNFVNVLKGVYGNDNVNKIDQSTYGIKNASVDMETLFALLHKAEEKGEKCKDGSELCLLTADEIRKQILSSSLIYQTRLDKIK